MAEVRRYIIPFCLIAVNITGFMTGMIVDKYYRDRWWQARLKPQSSVVHIAPFPDGALTNCVVEETADGIIVVHVSYMERAK